MLTYFYNHQIFSFILFCLMCHNIYSYINIKQQSSLQSTISTTEDVVLFIIYIWIAFLLIIINLIIYIFGFNTAYSLQFLIMILIQCIYEYLALNKFQ